VIVRIGDGPRVRGVADWDADAVTLILPGERVTLRYADLTRIAFDGARLHLADGRHTVSLRVRSCCGWPSARRTEAIARALQPIAGRPGARLPDDLARALR